MTSDNDTDTWHGNAKCHKGTWHVAFLFLFFQYI